MSSPASTWHTVDSAIEAGIPQITPGAVLYVSLEGRPIIERAYGKLFPDDSAPAMTASTAFDLASITKVFTATLFLRLVERGVVSLDTPVCEVLPAFAGVRALGGFEHPLTGKLVTYPYPQQEIDARRVTFSHLLTHTSGLADWLPLYREAGRDAALRAVYAQPFAYPPGQHCAYSDLGLILVGEAVAQLYQQPLEKVMREHLLEPLDAASIQYRPVPGDGSTPTWFGRPGNIAPTEICRWRQRRLWGEVDDENTGRMGGISGHAGLFGSARDVARLGEMYLGVGSLKGRPLLRPETIEQLTQSPRNSAGGTHCLGWMLYERRARTLKVGRATHQWSSGTFGHTGFTGGALWVDPQRRVVYVLLTNRMYYGRSQDFEADFLYREACARAVLSCLDGNGTPPHELG